MNRAFSFLAGALEALLIAVISLGLLLVPISIVWLFENDPDIDWLVAFRTASDIWLLSHGTRIVVPAGNLVGAEVPTFVISLMPLALTAIILRLAFLAGRRSTSNKQLWPTWVGAGFSYGAISLLISTSAYDVAVYPVSWQGTLLPPILMLLGLVAGGLIGRQTRASLEARTVPIERLVFENWLNQSYQKAHWAVRVTAIPALRAGTATVVMLLAISSIAIAILTGLSWIEITRLYEISQVSLLGSAILTIGQLALLPNLIIFGASWLTGAGFAIGTGSLISPLGTQLGPLPTIPILGALPVGQLTWGMVAIAVPMVLTAAAVLAVRRSAADMRFEFASAFASALAIGVGTALVATVQLTILAVLASGSAGPGRFAEIGINPWQLAWVFFAEVLVAATLAGFITARPNRDR